MEIIKLIVTLPKWLLLLVPRSIIAILNMFPCLRVCIYHEEYFSQYDPQYYRSYPIQYHVRSSEVLRLGHWLVAHLRGYCQKVTLFQVKRTKIYGVRCEDDHWIEKEIISRGVHKTKLIEIVNECKILSQ